MHLSISRAHASLCWAGISLNAWKGESTQCATCFCTMGRVQELMGWFCLQDSLVLPSPLYQLSVPFVELVLQPAFPAYQTCWACRPDGPACWSLEKFTQSATLLWRDLLIWLVLLLVLHVYILTWLSSLHSLFFFLTSSPQSPVSTQLNLFLIWLTPALSPLRALLHTACGRKKPPFKSSV